MNRWIAGVLCLTLMSGMAHAGEMLTVLLPARGEPVPVADLAIEAYGRYQMVYRDAPFQPHFLSMRPFQCLAAPPKLQCHLPYPYANDRRITEEDLGDLEYDLLFLVKQADEFGIDFWNGRYYRLRREGDTIVGEAQAVDMNILASKPEAGDTRPIGDGDLTALGMAETPFPRLRIVAAEAK
ncbi:hypothetical protein SADO_06097 [Salinisphaera dokdonensis CL-ES53]|uniref:Uncharacterized protein n=1 Tax=Salinisphaera dokdonensis CL-ES53 TaxID=1304272 RepID=A0ABV2AYV8_9GAMM